MAETAPPNNVVLHCEIQVEGETLWADTLISQRAWDVADEVTRAAFRERARVALADAVVRHYQAAIGAAEVTTTPARPATEET